MNNNLSKAKIRIALLKVSNINILKKTLKLGGVWIDSQLC